MKLWSAAAATLAAFVLSTQAHATTVLTFDEFAQAGTGLRDLTPSSGTLEYGGFIFKSAQAAHGFLSHRMSDAQNADPGGATLIHNWSGTLLEISKADGAVFDLISMDIADFSNGGGASPGVFEFRFADGSKETLGASTDTLRGLQTLALNRNGLKSFSITTASGNWWQMDNITLGEPAVGAVPEPGTWGMMILGFAGMGATLRRRRASQAALLTA